MKAGLGSQPLGLGRDRVVEDGVVGHTEGGPEGRRGAEGVVRRRRERERGERGDRGERGERRGRRDPCGKGQEGGGARGKGGAHPADDQTEIGNPGCIVSPLLDPRLFGIKAVSREGRHLAGEGRDRRARSRGAEAGASAAGWPPAVDPANGAQA